MRAPEIAGTRDVVVAAMSGGMQRVGAFTMLPALVRQLGADPITTLESAGLAADALDAPDKRVPYAALGRVLSETALLARCDHVGLLAGRLWRLADLGLVGDLMRNCATVGDALRTLTLWQYQNSESAVAFLREGSGVVDLGCAIYESGVDGVDQFADTYLAAAFNFLRELCGPEWVPSEVFLPHVQPSDCTQYRNLFKTQPHFNSEFCALRFPAHWMDKAIEGADPHRLRSARGRMRPATHPTLVQQVVRALRVLMLDGRSSGDEVARMLSLHRRTLNRRLRALGTTFQRVLDQVRLDVAQQLLRGSDISLDDLAAALGYAGVSPFMRTFKRWTGVTPTQWRRTARMRRISGPIELDHRSALQPADTAN
jgi:AraC-like DNA-binding protein